MAAPGAPTLPSIVRSAIWPGSPARAGCLTSWPGARPQLSRSTRRDGLVIGRAEYSEAGPGGLVDAHRAAAPPGGSKGLVPERLACGGGGAFVPDSLEGRDRGR